MNSPVKRQISITTAVIILAHAMAITLEKSNELITARFNNADAIDIIEFGTYMHLIIRNGY